MQYSHGIDAATARPISSLVLPSSLVAGFIWNVRRPFHQLDTIDAGICLAKSGTKPNVFWISPSVACWGDCAAGAPPVRFSAVARPTTEAANTNERAIFFIGISLWVSPARRSGALNDSFYENGLS